MNTTQTNKHTCSHPLAPAQAVFEAAMRDKVIALKSMLEHMVSSSDVGLVSHAEDKVRALNARGRGRERERAGEGATEPKAQRFTMNDAHVRDS